MSAFRMEAFVVQWEWEWRDDDFDLVERGVSRRVWCTHRGELSREPTAGTIKKEERGVGVSSKIYLRADGLNVSRRFKERTKRNATAEQILCSTIQRKGPKYGTKAATEQKEQKEQKEAKWKLEKKKEENIAPERTSTAFRLPITHPAHTVGDEASVYGTRIALCWPPLAPARVFEVVAIDEDGVGVDGPPTGTGELPMPTPEEGTWIPETMGVGAIVRNLGFGSVRGCDGVERSQSLSRFSSPHVKKPTIKEGKCGFTERSN